MFLSPSVKLVKDNEKRKAQAFRKVSPHTAQCVYVLSLSLPSCCCHTAFCVGFFFLSSFSHLKSLTRDPFLQHAFVKIDFCKI